MHEQISTADAAALAALAGLPPATVLNQLGTSADGLDAAEARRRLAQWGPNTTFELRRHPVGLALAAGFARPLPLLLFGLATVDFVTGQALSGSVIAVMVVLATVLGWFQEQRSERAVQRLQALIRTTAQVLRADPARPGELPQARPCPLSELVPGDIVLLSAGDLVPADVRFIATVDLCVDESALSGEALPVAKSADAVATPGPLLASPNLGFMGTHVASGTARAVVAATGRHTSFGHIAAALDAARERSDFDRGVDRVVGLLLRFMLVMAPLVMVLNWAGKGDAYEALLFATAVAVGLAPELLPMIVTINLANGALRLARSQVIVRRLGAVQTLGAIDILCTDKTGTLTQNRVVLEQHVDLAGRPSERVLDYACLNSYWQTGLRNLLDDAILAQAQVDGRTGAAARFRKAGEIPFDFQRRRMSVVVDGPGGTRELVCKGAVAEVTSACAWAELDGARVPLDPGRVAALTATVARLNDHGLRVIAIARRALAPAAGPLTDPALEQDMTLLGYIAFFDPPKESAGPALAGLARQGVAVKVLSGDNAAVCAHVCQLVGLGTDAIVDGSGLDELDDAAVGELVSRAQVFARLAPAQKTRVIRALQRQGHVVGFLGDGINDGPALKAADVGISVDSAADVARASADLILMQKSLVAVDEGIAVGRSVFGNIVKYLRMSASSNVGNMLSMVGASVLLPFLPMAPVQILLNNLLYDCAQAALTTDRVDAAFLSRPRRWDLAALRRYVLCLGPVSSLFDYLTFALLWFGLGGAHDPVLFQSGWFVESILSQTLIVYVTRTEAALSWANRPSAPLMAASVLVCGAAVGLTVSPLAIMLGLAPLPPPYWWGLGAILLGYAATTAAVKTALGRLARPA